MNKLLASLIATLFVGASFAQAPAAKVEAKAEAKPAAAAAKVEAKADAKPAAAAAKVEAKAEAKPAAKAASK